MKFKQVLLINKGEAFDGKKLFNTTRQLLEKLQTAPVISNNQVIGFIEKVFFNPDTKDVYGDIHIENDYARSDKLIITELAIIPDKIIGGKLKASVFLLYTKFI